MFKFEKAVRKSSKITPTTKGIKEMRIYKNVDNYVTKRIKESIKAGLRCVTIENYRIASKSISLWDYTENPYLMQKVQCDYLKDLIKEGYKVEEDLEDFTISWSHGVNEDA